MIRQTSIRLPEFTRGIAGLQVTRLSMPSERREYDSELRISAAHI